MHAGTIQILLHQQQAVPFCQRWNGIHTGHKCVGGRKLPPAANRRGETGVFATVETSGIPVQAGTSMYLVAYSASKSGYAIMQYTP